MKSESLGLIIARNIEAVKLYISSGVNNLLFVFVLCLAGLRIGIKAFFIYEVKAILISKKSGLIDAVLSATRSGGIFTWDIENFNFQSDESVNLHTSSGVSTDILSVK